MISNELERLAELRSEGVLTEEEFEAAKKKVLNPGPSDAAGTNLIFGVTPQNWIVLMHLSPLLWWAGGFGIAAPVVMWLISRDKSRVADRHGRVIVNWLLSLIVYLFISGALAFIMIGIPIGIVLGLISLVFPVIGAVRASEGRLWAYPLSIEFFSSQGPQESDIT
ncbi:MAG: hypothetical protein RLZZ458_2837 [Planctomycetota bacterium]|jgi:uncharacterized Tic20 family protein